MLNVENKSMRKIEDVIKSTPMTAASEETKWTGKPSNKKTDANDVVRKAFGKRKA